MAVAFRSKGEVAGDQWATTSSVITVKPTGLTAGDWMVAFVPLSTAATITPPSGFTLVTDNTNTSPSNTRLAVYQKIATAGDAAASNFTFTFSGDTITTGVILCGTGSDATTPVGANNTDATVDNDMTPSFNNTITPPRADCMLIIAAVASAGFAGMSGYAVATDNPTPWTEAHDSGTSAGDNYNFGIAYSATRAATTATGNSSLTGDDATQDWVGTLLAIQPPGAAAVTAKLLTLLGVGT